ncbi:MAG: hypothetical protein JSW73_03030 [Candidatus Woesearchaeota archaeon]|nr:MAG: hypothetical protein JSW73_03030 [Candidatus Woesearchaeota archaeon]
MKKLCIVLIIFIAVLFISGCTGGDTADDDSESVGPVTQNDLNELKEAIGDINPEEPDGPSEG